MRCKALIFFNDGVGKRFFSKALVIIVLEFNTLDDVFRIDFTEIITQNQLELNKKFEQLKLTRKIAIDEGEIKLAQEIYNELAELKTQIYSNMRIYLLSG